MRELKIGLVGAGWMGKAHALCSRTRRPDAGGKREVPGLGVLAEVREEIGSRSARELGFRRHTADW
ncbi:MAG: gfo/Idh/MocA family oxidoreductase, partial [Rhodospirillales bacterium]|nr:gfo/Idh/MocA family oxidoreductase [Rhodospirillales bacterium]